MKSSQIYIYKFIPSEDIMADTKVKQVATTQAEQGKLNLQPEVLEKLVANVMGAGEESGVAEITPELKQAMQKMMGGTGGEQMLTGGANQLQTANQTLGGNTSVTPDQIEMFRNQLGNSEYLNNQAQQITDKATQSLGQNINTIEQGSAMTGGLGSSRSALARGEAIGQSQEALSNALTNLYGQAGQRDTELAARLAQGNITNRLQQGGLQANLGLGQAGLGQQMGQEQIGNMLKAGLITQEQANAMKNQKMSSLSQQIPLLQALAGTQSNQVQDTTKTTKEKFDKNKLMLGAGTQLVGSGLNWLFGDSPDTSEVNR